MSDIEIFSYLNDNDWSVKAQDFLMDVINTSKQIINKRYNRETGTMTINTPDNEFTFKWILGNL